MARGRLLPGVKSLAVILHRQLHVALTSLQGYLRLPGLGMFVYVGKGLLGNPIQSLFKVNG
jgi:hypothetical protein